MTINDILKLEHTHESLNVINAFLNMPISQIDYETSILKYLEITDELKLYELGLKEAKSFLVTVELNKPTNKRVLIYKYLFEFSLYSNLYNEALNYLNLRKELLPHMEKYQSLLDELKYNKALNLSYYEILIKLKQDIIPNEIKIFVNEEIYLYHFSNQEYDECIKVVTELYDETLNKKYENLLIKLLYLNEQYEKVVLKSSFLIDENNQSIETIIYLISALRMQKKYRRASSIEAEYEHIIDNSNDLLVKEFAYEEIIKLYETMANQLSVDLYKSKLQKVKRQLRNTKEPKEAVKEEIIIKEIETKKLLSDANYLKHFSWIDEWLHFSHDLDLNIFFREYLRTLFIEIDKKIKFQDIIVYNNLVSDDSNYYHYKKERLYDKKVTNFYIENTIISETISNQTAIFGTFDQLNFTKDIITQKDIKDDFQYIYSIYLNDDLVICFYFDEVIKDQGLYFELLKGIGTIINLRIIDQSKNLHLKAETKYFQELIDNKVMPMRKMTLGKSYYNKVAQELFKIDYNKHLELFLRDVDLEDSKLLNDKIKRIFNYPNETAVIKYKYQDLVILEYLYAINIDNEITIFSNFINLTESFKLEQNLLNKATNDLETGLLNKNSLLTNFKNYLNDKTTLVLIDLNTDIKEVYGVEKTNQYFIEFANITKKHFNESDCYRYNYNQLIVVLNNNDIRRINNIMNDYFIVINNLKSNVLKHEDFKVSSGFIRYPVTTTETNVNKVFKYLDVALAEAKRKNINYADFTYSLYEQDVYEQEVINYLNEAIENKKINLRFKQIINLDRNTILNYESELYLANINIDFRYLLNIAKKRNKLIDLEYFHIEVVASFLNEIFSETGYYVNVLIKLSKETFFEPDFLDYLTLIFKKYKVPLKHIKILCDFEITRQRDLVVAEKVIKYGIKIETTNMDTLLNLNVDALHLNYKDSVKHRNYYKAINEYLTSLNTILIIKNVSKTEVRTTLKKLDITYIEGSIYKRLESMELINQIKANI